MFLSWSKDTTMKLSVIIPFYNETSSLTGLISRIKSVPIEKEIIIIDDGSTLEIALDMLEQIAGDNGLALIRNKKNCGKGEAIRIGLTHAIGDAVIIQDADTEYFPEDYSHLVKAYEINKAKAVYGVRDLSKRSWLMLLGNRFLTLVTNILFRGKITDMETCYKLVNRETMVALNLTSKGFEIEAEITAKLLLMGIQIWEVPIQYSERKQGKKLTPLDGIPTLYTLFRCLLWKPKTDLLTIKNS